jgi:quinoprotein dehydrogenase-associated probable ABC transporter substrate-binding protein
MRTPSSFPAPVAARVRIIAAGLVATLSVLATPANAAETATPPLKVCADPYMLPFSNKDGAGYENKIAQLFAERLQTDLAYEWFPQRMGFIRQTLRSENTDGSYKCDLVISVPERFELAATTEPYYTSTYVLAYVKGRGLDDVTSPEMLAKVVEQGRDVRIGLADAGPAQLWVFRQGLMDHMVPYMGQPADPHVSPGETLMRDIAAGKIDVSIVWGPSAGYFARQLKDQGEFVLLNLHDDPKYPDMKFEFSIAMAVRHGEKEWLDKVDALIKENQPAIEGILRDYGVPLLPLRKSPRRDDDDD